MFRPSVCPSVRQSVRSRVGTLVWLYVGPMILCASIWDSASRCICDLPIFRQNALCVAINRLGMSRTKLVSENRPWKNVQKLSIVGCHHKSCVIETPMHMLSAAPVLSRIGRFILMWYFSTNHSHLSLTEVPTRQSSWTINLCDLAEDIRLRLQ